MTAYRASFVEHYIAIASSFLPSGVNSQMPPISPEGYEIGNDFR